MSIREGDIRIDVIPLRPGHPCEDCDELLEHNPRKVRLTHIPTGIQVESLAHSSTVTAKTQALELLNLELMWHA